MTADTGGGVLPCLAPPVGRFKFFMALNMKSCIPASDYEALLILELQITFSKKEDMHIWTFQIMRMDCVCYIYYLCVHVCNCMVTVFPPNKI